MVAQKANINQFLIGDIFEISFNPNAENPEWVREWNRPLRDNDDIRVAREIFQTNGDCLGWGHAAIKDKWGYRTRTPEAPEIQLLTEVEHFWAGDGKPIGIRGTKFASTIERP